MNGLRVLITNCLLAGRTGSEMYVHDLALALAARGHTPLVYSPKLGALAGELVKGGVEVRDSLEDFSQPPDIVHGQHTVPAVEALLRFREIPGIYVCHDATYRVDTPPLFPRILRYVAVDYNCRERVTTAGVPPDRIRVIFNSVDLARFKPRASLPERPTRALLFSNYANERTHLGAVREACSRASLPLDVIGSEAGNPSTEPEAVIGQYDLVFAKARCALEAMAVGTAVILCDFRGAGEMVKSADVDEFRRWNFGARLLRQPLDPQILLKQIARYDPSDATVVSRRIRASAGLDDQVDQLIALYGEVLTAWKRARKPSRRSEVRSAAIALRAVRPPVPLRERIRRIGILGPALVMIKRMIFGPRIWR
jgi:glycosyltransferase involved in cell wall biosynthesis